MNIEKQIIDLSNERDKAVAEYRKKLLALQKKLNEGDK